MSTNILNQAPFLRTTRSFPQEIQAISVEIDRAYVDIANSVNTRTIGIFPVNKPIVNGESWFLGGSTLRQQALRQVYQFSGAGTIAHGINTTTLTGFTRIYGSFTNGTNFYPLPYIDATAANNQIEIYIGPTNINIVAGGGAPPAIVSGTIVLEWLSRV